MNNFSLLNFFVEEEETPPDDKENFLNILQKAMSKDPNKKLRPNTRTYKIAKELYDEIDNQKAILLASYIVKQDKNISIDSLKEDFYSLETLEQNFTNITDELDPEEEEIVNDVEEAKAIIAKFDNIKRNKAKTESGKKSSPGGGKKGERRKRPFFKQALMFINIEDLSVSLNKPDDYYKTAKKIKEISSDEQVGKEDIKIYSNIIKTLGDIYKIALEKDKELADKIFQYKANNKLGDFNEHIVGLTQEGSFDQTIHKLEKLEDPKINEKISDITDLKSKAPMDNPKENIQNLEKKILKLNKNYQNKEHDELIREITDILIKDKTLLDKIEQILNKTEKRMNVRPDVGNLIEKKLKNILTKNLVSRLSDSFFMFLGDQIIYNVFNISPDSIGSLGDTEKQKVGRKRVKEGIPIFRFNEESYSEFIDKLYNYYIK